MTITMSRRQFCGASLTLAVPPTLRAVSPNTVSTPSPDASIIEAVEEWLRLQPILEDIQRCREDAFDSSMELVGACVMNDYDGNRAWWDRWNDTPAGKLEWEWEQLARISDQHMTFATNTRAVTANGIAAKIRLYRASLEHFDDDDPYMLERIEDDIAALLSGREA
jgi:hypothetical protein